MGNGHLPLAICLPLPPPGLPPAFSYLRLTTVLARWDEPYFTKKRRKGWFQIRPSGPGPCDPWGCRPGPLRLRLCDLTLCGARAGVLILNQLALPPTGTRDTAVKQKWVCSRSDSARGHTGLRGNQKGGPRVRGRRERERKRWEARRRST